MIKAARDQKKKQLAVNCGGVAHWAKYNDNQELSHIHGNDRLLKAALFVLDETEQTQFEMEFEELRTQSKGWL